MPLVRRDVKKVTGPQLDRQFVALEMKPRCPLQYHDPFVLFLVVPEAFRRCVAMRDDSLNAEVVGFELLGEKLGRQVIGKIRKKIKRREHHNHFHFYLQNRF
jgi:hypothetical protein